MRKPIVAVVLLMIATLSGCSKSDSSSTPNAAVTPEQARAIAKDAYIYGFPMVDSYRVQYSYFVDKNNCLLYTSPSPRDRQKSRMPSSA